MYKICDIWDMKQKYLQRNTRQISRHNSRTCLTKQELRIYSMLFLTIVETLLKWKKTYQHKTLSGQLNLLILLTVKKTLHVTIHKDTVVFPGLDSSSTVTSKMHRDSSSTLHSAAQDDEFESFYLTCFISATVIRSFVFLSRSRVVTHMAL